MNHQWMPIVIDENLRNKRTKYKVVSSYCRNSADTNIMKWIKVNTARNGTN